MFTWTVDVETDWGGRTDGDVGINEGLPLILELFRAYDIKAIFFVSTELIQNYRDIFRTIQDKGHTLGSHGHFHTVYKEKFRAKQDYLISQEILSGITGTHSNPFRAPKFSYKTDWVYSDPKNHIGLLKYMRFGGALRKNSIIYLHPFDIVKSKNAPNLFCKLWYSNPDKAYLTLTKLVNYGKNSNSDIEHNSRIVANY